MRHLAAINSTSSAPVALITMRGKYDCLTCVTAMLLGIKYEDVETAFGGNIDPSKDRAQESQRVYTAFRELIERHDCGILELFATPQIAGGRRYWVGVRIDDPTNSLSQVMGHAIVIDEAGRVFDPNPNYGEFQSLKDWSAAMSLPHEIESVTEMFTYSL